MECWSGLSKSSGNTEITSNLKIQVFDNEQIIKNDLTIKRQKYVFFPENDGLYVKNPYFRRFYSAHALFVTYYADRKW
jgi:hypothetical protein